MAVPDKAEAALLRRALLIAKDVCKDTHAEFAPSPTAMELALTDRSILARALLIIVREASPPEHAVDPVHEAPRQAAPYARVEQERRQTLRARVEQMAQRKKAPPGWVARVLEELTP